MSFKIKCWGTWRSVDLTEYVEGLTVPGGAVNGYCYPWQGKILSLGYDASDDAIYIFYDPITDTVDGPHPGPPGERWSVTSPFYGDSVRYYLWGNRYLIGWPGGTVQGGTNKFWGWDASGNFLLSDMSVPSRPGYTSSTITSSSRGWDGSDPTVMLYTFHQNADNIHHIQEVGVAKLEGGYTMLQEVEYTTGSPENIYVAYAASLALIGWAQRGSYFTWIHDPIDSGLTQGALYSTIPTVAEKDAYLALGEFGGDLQFNPMGRTFGATPADGAFAKCQLYDTYREPVGGQYWANADDVLSPIDPLWVSKWDHMSQLDGGYPLDEDDLDGAGHGIITPSAGGIISLGPNGWYVSTGAYNSNPYNFTIYCLDPWPPGGAARLTDTQGISTLGWVGEYAIRPNMKLAHILPLPEDRAPSGGGVYPPIEQSKTLIGSREVFDAKGNAITYRRGVKVKLEGYPLADEDFRFPGLNPDGTYDGFWQLFGGNPTSIAFMPDPMWGMLNPLGELIGRSMGAPTENLSAVEPDPTHIITSAKLVSGTTFATRLFSDFTVPRYQLTSSLDGSVLCYAASGENIASPPSWAAVAGSISGTAWTTLVDFSEVEPPGLGETNWTIRSVVPIPKCRGLAGGGFLVGATLYFDPWVEGDWGWTPGGRAATFTHKNGTETGNGWVPAKPGYIGPVNNDYHEPKLLVAFDEWTIGRSLYGPDALLVYDREGNFVECLNSMDLHAPDAREIMVTEQSVPMLIYRVYRHGTYSDFAEGYGRYHRLGPDEEIQAPLYAAYDLVNAAGQIAPGAGRFRGFVDMYAVGDYAPQDGDWRWDIAGTLYDSSNPRTLWSPPGSSYVRGGRGGLTITPLAGGPSSSRNGVRGVGSRA